MESPVLNPTPNPSDLTEKTSNLWGQQKYLFITLSFVIILVLIIGIILYRTFQVKPAAQKTDNPIIATVGQTQIYKSQVESLAKSQYLPSAVNGEVIKKYLDILIERSILDQEAQKLGLTVTQSEIDQSLLKKQSSQSAQTKNLNDFVKYQILKDKIMAKNVKSVEAYTIGFWIPPDTEFNTPEFITQRKDGQKALQEAFQKLSTGEKPYSVTQSIYQKYKSLQPILGLNGYNFGATQDLKIFDSPRTFPVDQAATAKYNDPGFYELLATMSDGQVKLYKRSQGAGGDVILMISSKLYGYTTFDDYYQAKYQSLVKIN